jgi:hypothetical protein
VTICGHLKTIRMGGQTSQLAAFSNGETIAGGIPSYLTG